MKTIIKILIVILTIATIAYMCNTDNSIPVEDDFGSQWRDSEYGKETLSIARSIVHGNVTGCGVFKVRQSYTNPSHYLLACSNMNEPIRWNYYIVDTDDESIVPYYGEVEEPEL